MLTIRKGNLEAGISALVTASNGRLAAMAVAESKYHKDATTDPAGSNGDHTAPTRTALSITTANATSDTDMVPLANELQAKLLIHFADAIAHKVADTTNSAALAAGVVATSGATAQTLASLIQTAWNAHDDSTTFHYTADTTDDGTSITTTATARTSLNAVKAAFNLHLASNPGGDYINLVSA